MTEPTKRKEKPTPKAPKQHLRYNMNAPGNLKWTTVLASRLKRKASRKSRRINRVK